MNSPSQPPDRSRRSELALATLALALVLAVFLRDSLFGGAVLCQADFLLESRPWSAVAPDGFRASNPLLEDQGLLMEPWLEFAAERVRAGEFPLWNPYNYAGQPIHAANSAAFLWPLHLLYYASPGWGYYALSAFVRLLLAGLFTFALLRRLGVGPWAALPGACAYMLSGFLVVWLGHPHTNIAPLVPALLIAVERMAARPSWREAGLTALLVGLALLGGHFQTTLHVFLFVGAYALARTFHGPSGPLLRGRAWVRLACGGVLGLGLAAPQLLPFAEYVGASRGAEVLETVEQTSEVSPLAVASTLVAPDRFGRPDHGDYDGPSGVNVNYNEIVGGYVGRVALLLALVGLWSMRRDPRGRFFGAAFVVCALVAWHVPGVYDLARTIPKLRSTNLTRLLIVVAFSLSILAGIGLDTLIRRAGLEGRRAAGAALLVLAALAIELVGWGRGYNPEVDPALLYPATPATDFLREHAGIDRVMSVEGSTLRPSANLPYRLQLLTGYDKLELRELNELVLRLTNAPPEIPFLSVMERMDRLQALPLASVLGVRWILANSELPPPLRRAWPDPSSGELAEGDLRIFENPLALPRAFVARGATVIEDPQERLDRLAAADLDPWHAILERAPEGEVERRALAALADPGAEHGQVAVTSYQPREIRLRAKLTSPGLVVLSDAWMRGWTARVEDRELPIERVDHALRGVFLDAGDRELVLRYDPPSFRLGMGIGLAAAGLMLVALAFGGRPARPEEQG
jgi:hypothetical protein